MNFRQLLSVLIARWKVVLFTFGVVVGIAAAYSLLTPKQYSATAEVLIDLKSADPILGTLPAMASSTYVTTQLDVIRSTRIALNVVRKLKLDENPDLRQSWMEATNGRGDLQNWVAQLLQRNLVVKPSRDSNVIDVTYYGNNPKFAAGLANAFVQAYVDTTLQLKVDPARLYSGFFDERSKKLRDELEQTQQRLSTYQREKGIVATDERLDVEVSRLNELSSQLVSLQALAADSSIRLGQVKRNGDQMQEVLQNPLISGLKSDLARQEARLQELSAKLGPNHPQIVEAVASIESIKAKLASETSRITNGLGVTSTINKAREIELRAALDAQRNKVLKTKQLRDELQILQRELENAQRAYDGVVSRGNLTALESQSQQTNIAVLSQAAEPTEPTSPRIFFNLAVAVVIGAVLALFAGLLHELLDRRVRSPREASLLSKLPVIGVIPGPDGRAWKGRRLLRTQTKILSAPAAR